MIKTIDDIKALLGVLRGTDVREFEGFGLRLSFRGPVVPRKELLDSEAPLDRADDIDSFGDSESAPLDPLVVEFLKRHNVSLPEAD